MMNTKIFSAMALAVCAFGAHAGEMVYTFAGDKPIVTHSSYRAETCDLAICLDNPLLAGKKITHIRVLTDPSAQPSEDYNVWLSSALNLVPNEAGKKVNAPDIVTVPGTPGDGGWLDVDLPVPYVLTDKPVYVGYSFTITSYSDDGGRPIPYSQDRHAGGFWFHGSKSAVKWMDYENRMLGVLPIYVTIEGDFTAQELGVSGWATEYPYAQIDREFSLPVNVMNLGTEPVSEIEYSYSTADGRHSGSVHLGAPLQSDIVNGKKLFLTFAPLSSLGEQTLTLTIDKVNGKENLSTFREAVLPVDCRSLVPSTRVVLEEGTGTWCSACPRGAAAIEALTEQYGGSFIGVAYHKGQDPMLTDCVPPVNFNYFPSAVLNRGDVIDPYFGDDNSQTKAFAIQPLVEAALALPASAAVEVKSEWTDDSREGIRAKATVAFASPVNDGNYRVIFMLLGNGLKGTGSMWMQSNGLVHNDPSRIDDVLRPLYDRGNPIVDMEYDHVALISDAPDAGFKIPASLPALQQMEVYRDFDLSEAVSRYEGNAGESLVQDKDRLDIVAILVDKGGKILNAAKAPVGGSSESSVSSISGGDGVVAVEYYDLCGHRTDASATGLVIRLERMADGSVKSSKTMR